jgi:HupE / UreJ protein
MSKKSLAFLSIALLLTQPAWAHVIVGELEKMSAGSAAILYLKLGYQHIIPLGFDHILFVLSLFLLNPRLKPVLWQATAFTVAHSVTLGLAMYHVITPPTRIVEPLIALSILYVALENIFSASIKTARAGMQQTSTATQAPGVGVKPSRVGVVFLFGLVHGMGFASALGQLGLPQKSYLLSLVMFNAGVELGQVTIILLAFFLVGKWFRDKPWYRSRIVIPISIAIALVAACWTVQRLVG